MGEAKTRAERRRAEREAQSAAVIRRPDAPQDPPAQRYRQKLVDFVPEVYAEIEKERTTYNTAHDVQLSFDAFLNGLLVISIERERLIRQNLADRERMVQAPPKDIVEQVLARHRAATQAP